MLQTAASDWDEDMQARIGLGKDFLTWLVSDVGPGLKAWAATADPPRAVYVQSDLLFAGDAGLKTTYLRNLTALDAKSPSNAAFAGMEAISTNGGGVADLLGLLTAKSPAIRRYALGLLPESKGDDLQTVKSPESRAKIKAMLHDDSYEVVRAAIDCLAKLDDDRDHTASSFHWDNPTKAPQEALDYWLNKQ